MTAEAKTVHIQYYAVLREQRGASAETLSTSATTALELYRELQSRHNFHLTPEYLRVVINTEFRDWETPIQDEDTVVFIPPVAGG